MRGIRLAAVGGCVALTSFMWLPPAVAEATPRLPAAAAAACPQAYEKQGSPASQMTSEPWPEQMLNFTDVWPLTRGKGVTVAVIDSGVDKSHPQLTNVTKTVDLTRTNLVDCVGHGTGVAGIIVTRVASATCGSTELLHDADRSPNPLSITTVGLPVPTQLMCSR